MEFRTYCFTLDFLWNPGLASAAPSLNSLCQIVKSLHTKSRVFASPYPPADIALYLNCDGQLVWSIQLTRCELTSLPLTSLFHGLLPDTRSILLYVLLIRVYRKVVDIIACLVETVVRCKLDYKSWWWFNIYLDYKLKLRSWLKGESQGSSILLVRYDRNSSVNYAAIVYGERASNHYGILME